MWLFTVHGFYSIVQKADEVYHIRSRHEQDLINLNNLAGINKSPVKSYPGSDYPWRIIVNTTEKDFAVLALGRDVKYSNYKSAVLSRPDQDSKIEALHEIWSIMRQTQAQD